MIIPTGRAMNTKMTIICEKLPNGPPPPSPGGGGSSTVITIRSDAARPSLSVADLEEMDVNIDVKMTSEKIKDLSIIKRITTATHKHRFERKGKDAYEGRLHVKLWFTTNKIPDTGGEGAGESPPDEE